LCSVAGSACWTVSSPEAVEFDLVQVVDAPGVTQLTYRTMAQTPGAASCDRPPAVEGVQRTRARYGRRRVLCCFHESGRCCALRLQDQQCRPQPGGVEIRAGLHTGEAELFGAKLSAGSTGSRGASGAGRRIWAPMVSRRARTPLLAGGAATVDRAHRCRRTDRILQRADRTAPQRWGEKVERALPERLAPFR